MAVSWLVNGGDPNHLLGLSSKCHFFGESILSTTKFDPAKVTHTYSYSEPVSCHRSTFGLYLVLPMPP